jgi:hypothetical protein
MADGTRIVAPAAAAGKFDAAALWEQLPEAVRRRIGVAAIVEGYARAMANHVGPDRAAGFYAAEEAAGRVLLESLPARVIGRGGPLLPDLAPLGVRACRRCGCTDAVGCEEGCAWVDTDLCSNCLPRGGLRPW